MVRVLLLVAVLLCTGCMDLNMRVRVNANGTGDLECRLELRDQMFQLIRDRAPRDGLDFTQLDKEALQGLIEGTGGKLRRYDNQVVSGVRVIDMAARFTDAEKVFSRMGGQMLRLEQAGADTWIWHLGDTEYGATFNGLSPELLEQQLAGFRSQMQGLKVNLFLEAPNIDKTVAFDRASNTTATFTFDFDKDIGPAQGKRATDAFKKLLAPKSVQFSGVKPPKPKTEKGKR